MIRPVDAGISQRFGENPTRNLPWNSWLIQTFGNYQPDGHTGEDYACPVGTPVRAVADGTVLHIGWMGGTYDQNPWWIQPSFAGYHAVIDHGSFIGIYGHCQDGSAKVAKGSRVTEGQVFILSGNTGGSTGPHLHFEILPDGWVLNSTFYGRIDPESLFAGSLGYAGTITTQSATQEEDFMATLSEEEKNALFGVLDTLNQRTAKLPDEKDMGIYWKALIGAVDQINGNAAALVSRPPADIAADLNAAGVAAQVRDELVKLLGGQK